MTIDKGHEATVANAVANAVSTAPVAKRKPRRNSYTVHFHAPAFDVRVGSYYLGQVLFNEDSGEWETDGVLSSIIGHPVHATNPDRVFDGVARSLIDKASTPAALALEVKTALVGDFDAAELQGILADTFGE